MQIKSTFHEGELAVQQRAGEKHIAVSNSVVIAGTILNGAIPFIEKQFMVVLSSIDERGSVWSSVIYGHPGFARVESPHTISINIPTDLRDLSDPFWTNIELNSVIGMLFIELGSRRRYRINGKLQYKGDDSFEIGVSEAYPNCPKYIQRRHLSKLDNKFTNFDVVHGIEIDDKIKSLITSADTMFVGSYNLENGADASHRGGNTGFIQIVDNLTLRIPDYDGNSLFNTLGNIELNPHTGLCIPDFKGQQLLQLTGAAKLLWNQDDPHNLTGGTRRFWVFEVKQWILRHVPQQLEWEYLDASPFNLPTQSQV